MNIITMHIWQLEWTFFNQIEQQCKDPTVFDVHIEPCIIMVLFVWVLAILKKIEFSWLSISVMLAGTIYRIGFVSHVYGTVLYFVLSCKFILITPAKSVSREIKMGSLQALNKLGE